MKIEYKNRYGSLLVETEGSAMRIGQINSRLTNYRFDIETAEKIALITSNRIQMAPANNKLNSWYLIYRTHTNMAYLARVHNLEYIDPSKPMDALETESHWRYKTKTDIKIIS